LPEAYDVTIVTVRPGTHPQALAVLGKSLADDRNLLACWYSEIGAVNQILIIRKAGDASAAAPLLGQQQLEHIVDRDHGAAVRRNRDAGERARRLDLAQQFTLRQIDDSHACALMLVDAAARRLRRF